MADPLAAWLRPGPPAPADGVAATLARALLPEEATDAPPPWLRDDQRLSFRRAMAAVRRHGGALLADGVGTGKTFIALAVANAIEPGRPVHVIAPAALRGQWCEAAGRTGVSIRTHSHETLSRGRAPPSAGGAVIIDESHRFRTESTRRYATLAPWCVGRRGILLSGTPVVNRLEDLVNPLLLLVRDDALAWSGVSSLRGAMIARVPGALATLVITGEDRSPLLPARRELGLRPEASGPVLELLAGIRRLALSADASTAELLRIVLLRALASSPAAAATTLRRYGAMLRHARDAAVSGQQVTRETIRRFVGTDADQLVFWPLVAEPAQRIELVVEDLEHVAALERVASRACVEPDPKAAALADVVGDRKPTLIFTTAMATVAYLRDRLPRPGIAWCTGAGAGLDRGPVPRDAVLDWFRRRALPSDGRIARPAVLLATDVAAEGLDLPLVERVVHYDLPWTAVRLEQRSGRAFRLGSRHASVEVVRFDPPPELAALLRQESILEAKAGLPFLVGLDQRPEASWRLRARIAAMWEGHAGGEGTAIIPGSEPGTVAGLRIGFADGTAREIVLARTDAGWTDETATIANLLQGAHGRRAVSRPVSSAALRTALRGLSGQVGAVLRAANGAGLGAVPRSNAVRTLRRRLRALAACAARNRHRAHLHRLEQGIRYLRRGLTSGEELQLEEWGRLSDAALLERLDRLPPEPVTPAPSSVALIGVLLVEPWCRES